MLERRGKITAVDGGQTALATSTQQVQQEVAAVYSGACQVTAAAPWSAAWGVLSRHAAHHRVRRA